MAPPAGCVRRPTERGGPAWAKAAAVIFGALIGIPVSLTCLALVAILFPPALLTAPLVAAGGWAMGYNVCMGRKPEDFGPRAAPAAGGEPPGPARRRGSALAAQGGPPDRRRAPSMYRILLVRLTADQIEKAKAANGRRRRITHALLCGQYGQIFGTETQCRKYFEVWRPEYRFEVRPGYFKSMFPDLFSDGAEMQTDDIPDYKTTFNLVTRLIEAQQRCEAGLDPLAAPWAR